MTFELLLIIGFIILATLIIRDLNKQLKAYEQQQREHRETISQIASAAKTNNKMDQKQSSGKSKGSGSKRKKNTEHN